MTQTADTAALTVTDETKVQPRDFHGRWVTRPAHEPGPLEIVRADGSARSEVFVAPDAAIGFLPRFDDPDEYLRFCRTVPLNDEVLSYVRNAMAAGVAQARQDDIAKYVDDSMPTIAATADERFGTEDSPEKTAFIESERTRYADYVRPQVEERIPLAARSQVPEIARAALVNVYSDQIPDAQVTVYGETMPLTEAREKYAHTRCLDAARQGMLNYAAALGDRPTGALIRETTEGLKDTIRIGAATTNVELAKLSRQLDYQAAAQNELIELVRDLLNTNIAQFEATTRKNIETESAGMIRYSQPGDTISQQRRGRF